MAIKDFNQLRKNLKKDYSTFPEIKIAVIGDVATQFFCQALKGHAYEVNINLSIYEADYDQIEMQIYSPDSELYHHNPEFVIIFQSSPKLLSKFYKTPHVSRANFAVDKIAETERLWQTIENNSKAKIIYFNYPEINDSVFGNFSNKVESSFLFQLRKVNYLLMESCSKNKSVFINDLASIYHHHGSSFCFDSKIYYSSTVATTFDVLPIISKSCADIIMACKGKFIKCLILDLDNTLWGGVIGDDGLNNIQIGDLGIGKAFLDLQFFAKELKARGIILAVCSKNTEHIAKEPFEKHPDMVLKLEDIAVFVANWDNKVDNIKYIKSVLNIGYDTMVFLDDNPFERNVIRENLPEVIVPELPEDPTEYVSYLRNLNLFETATFSEADIERTAQYQQEAQREELHKSFTSIDDYLESLYMKGTITKFDTFNIPRLAQLSQRSNQFNLRTVRYSEKEIEDLMHSNDHIPLYVELEDKFGDYGLISMIVLKKRPDGLFIDTWLMSCRVLKRGVEQFVLNQLAEIAAQENCEKLIGEYLPTEKNSMVKDHYHNLGFTEKNGLWYLYIKEYFSKNHFINKTSSEINS